MFNELLRLYESAPELFDEESSNLMEILLILDSLKLGVIPPLSQVRKQMSFLAQFITEKVYVPE